MKARRYAYAGIVAALYVVLCVVLQPISYGPIQVRIAEALTVLPYYDPIFIPALYIGAMIANIFGGFGAIDIFLGSLLTLIAAYFTWKMPKWYLAPLPVVLINAFGVAAYLSPLAKVPYFPTVGYIALGEIISAYGLGIILMVIINKRNIFKREIMR